MSVYTFLRTSSTKNKISGCIIHAQYAGLGISYLSWRDIPLPEHGSISHVYVIQITSRGVPTIKVAKYGGSGRPRVGNLRVIIEWKRIIRHALT